MDVPLVLLAQSTAVDPKFVLQELVVGLSNGAVYALIALGYTMVYGIVELINFAHGDVFMIGSFVSVVLLGLLGVTGPMTGLPLVGVLLIVGLGSMLFCGLLGVVIERIAYRPLRNAPRLAPLISAIGISLILENAALIHFGNNNVAVPPVFPDARLDLKIVTINWLDIVVIVSAVVLMVVLQFLVQRTRIGRAMRSIAQDRDAAALMGVDVDRTIAITFFIGAALAGAAGLIYALELRTTYFLSGFQLGLIAFTAAVLGGIGNIAGAMLGGVVIGLVQALVVVIGNQFPGLQLSRWTEAVVFAILIIILVFRPTGLLGQQVPEKV